MSTQISLKEISVQVNEFDGTARLILLDVSVSFVSNEKIGMLGCNGSGKTKIVRLLCGLDKPSGGKLIKRPESVRVMTVLQRPEEHFTRSTVGEQINSYAPISLSPAEIHELMKMVGLSVELGGKSPLRLSSGQQRLVAIACALSSGAPFIVFDEPMAGLDLTGRNLVKNALIELNLKRDLGYMIVSHHPDDLLGLVDRLWVLEKGRLIYDGPFQHASPRTLNACLSKEDLSMYYWMCKLESDGTVLPDEIYKTSKPEKIVDYLQGLDLP